MRSLQMRLMTLALVNRRNGHWTRPKLEITVGGSKCVGTGRMSSRTNSALLPRREFPGTGSPVPDQTLQAMSWPQWQLAVLQLLRADFAEVLHHIGFEEVDWVSWRDFYNAGRTPVGAVNRALERDF
jgi:hypothetical protein